jgi:hypothetical protein
MAEACILPDRFDLHAGFMTEREQLGTRGGAFPADVGLMVRKAGGEVDVVPLQSARLSVRRRVPWRDFRWYRGQRHFSGSYWSATMQAHVGYESRLEYANLLLADFDPRVDWILSQPFLLEGEDKGTRRRHIPDYLIVHADHTVCVVDVKPAAKLTIPKVRDSLSWSRRVIEPHGWEYRVQSEPDEVLLRNVQFLAGYRRSLPVRRRRRHRRARRAEIAHGVRRGSARDPPVTGGLLAARALVLHLLWTRRLSTDLTRLLSATSIVTRA